MNAAPLPAGASETVDVGSRLIATDGEHTSLGTEQVLDTITTQCGDRLERTIARFVA